MARGTLTRPQVLGQDWSQETGTLQCRHPIELQVHAMSSPLSLLPLLRHQVLP